jgi:hypothetical protein
MEERRDEDNTRMEERNLGTRTGRLEETRRGVEKMAVEEQESGTGTQASGVFGHWARKAKGGWDRVKKMLEGKKVVGRTDGVTVVLAEGQEGTVRMEMEDWKEGTEEDTVTVTIEQEDRKDTASCNSVGTSTSRTTRDVLDGLEIEERDVTLDNKLDEGRKRKREEDMPEKQKGLKGLPGWERRSKETKDDSRWKRTTVRWEKDDKGQMDRKEERVSIPIPESFDLGRERKGMEINNSNRLNNNFGTNREALFPGGKSVKQEGKNWLASFTKKGCVSCRNEDGKLSHRGRDGRPVTMLVGDESVPTVEGYTKEGKIEGQGDECVWVFKKEHMGLDEVSGVLRKINLDKRAADRQAGKRDHDFFLPNGSKLLVASYVHLRREGLDGYISDFIAMVRNVSGVTGRAAIEVLPVVPVVREGLDEVGRELITGVREWIRWISEKTERKSIEKLVWTGGREMSSVQGSTLIWRPSFLHRKTGGEDRKVDGLVMLTGDRIETRLHAAEGPREIERLKTGAGDKMETESAGSENVNRNESEVNGISIEGEFAFTKAVGEFLKEEVREGGYKRNYVLNVKEQLRMRTLREDEDERKLRVVLLGSSQLNRIGSEMEKKNKGKIEIVDRVRLEGAEMCVNMEKAKRVLEEHGDEVDVVLVAGPGNSLVVHGKEGERGFAGEREVRIMKKENGEEDWSVRYHLTDR